MKYSVFPIIAALCIVMISCKKIPAQVNQNLIAINKCQSYNRDEKILTICLDSVLQDSRCPIGAVCIWQGIAVARFKVNTQNTDHPITLATSDFAPFRKDTTVAGCKIEMINLLPERVVDKSFNYKDYVAEVRITKL